MECLLAANWTRLLFSQTLALWSNPFLCVTFSSCYWGTPSAFFWDTLTVQNMFSRFSCACPARVSVCLAAVLRPLRNLSSLKSVWCFTVQINIKSCKLGKSMEDVDEAPIAQSLECAHSYYHLKHIPVAGLVLECCPPGLFHAASWVSVGCPLSYKTAASFARSSSAQTCSSDWWGLCSGAC